MRALLVALFEVSVSVGAVVLLLAALGPLLCRRYTAKWRYWVWLLLAVRLLLPVKLTLPQLLPEPPVQLPIPHRIVYQAPPEALPQGDAENKPAFVLPEEGEAAITEQPNADAVQPDPQPSIQPEQPSRVFTLIDLLIAGWLLGAAGLLAVQLGGYALQKRRILRLAISAPELWPAAQREAALLGIPKPVPVWYAPRVQSPLLLGILRPRILLPKRSYSAQELSMILRHELIHYRRRDVRYKLVLLLACCLHWANPAVWLMAALARTDIERACDEEVVRGQNASYRAAYGESILSLLRQGAGQGLLCSTSFSSGKRGMTLRIKGIFDTRKKHKGLAALALLLAVSIAAGSLVACTGAASAPSVETTSAPEEPAPLDIALVPEPAMRLIENVEYYGQGRDFSGEPMLESHVLRALFFTVFPTKASREPYREQTEREFYWVPIGVMEEMYTLFTGNPAQLEEPYEEKLPFENFKTTVQFPSIDLQLLELTELEEGVTSYRFARSFEGEPLRPVTYTIRKTVATEVPESLREQYPEGSPLYQLVSVVNEPMETLNPEVKTVEIGTVEEFLAFVEDYNENGLGYEGNTYRLTADLDLAGVSFNPIGQNSPTFLGDLRNVANEGFNSIFDGNGHTLRNMTITNETANQKSFRGLFAIVGVDGIVQNLTIENAKVEGCGDEWSRNEWASTATGILAGNCRGVLKNCTVQGSVRGTGSVGGLCGEIRGLSQLNGENLRTIISSITDCSADATVEGIENVGAFAGIVLEANITDCTANGTVSAVTREESEMPYYVGGFAGLVMEANLRGVSASVAIKQEGPATGIGAFAGGVYTDSGSTGCTDCHYDPAKAGDLPPVGTSEGDLIGGQEVPLDITPRKGDAAALNQTRSEISSQIAGQGSSAAPLDGQALEEFNKAKKEAEEALK